MVGIERGFVNTCKTIKTKRLKPAVGVGTGALFPGFGQNTTFTACNMSKNLFISLSQQHVLCAEKDVATHGLLMEKDINVQYNQSPAEAFFKSFESTGSQYQVVYCALKHPFFVLVPEVLFNSQQPAACLPGIDLKGKRVMYDKVARNGVVCVYTMEEDWYREFTQLYPNVILRHYASVLIDYTVKNGFVEQQPVVTIDLEDGIFYLCISNKTELLLCNRFAFKMPEDILYFLLYSLEQFQLSPQQCQLHIGGMVSENAGAVVLLNEYFEQVSLDESHALQAQKFKNQAAFFHQEACV